MRILTIVILSAFLQQFAQAQLYAPGGTTSAVANGSNNIGIGTSAPESKLHVLDGNGGEQIKISRGTGSVRFVQDNNADNLYLFNSDASKTFMFWGQNGNVGIGTYNPDYKLHIVDGDGGAQLKFQRGTGIATIAQDNNQNDLYIDAPGGLMLNYSGGNVGIGTFASDYKLHIKDGNGGAQLKFQRGTGIATISQDNNLNDLYIDAPAGLLLNYGGGNVGIGTAHPDRKLTVKGTIHAEEVLVDLSVPGPDYIFEKDYNLLPLSELEAYIKANKHLPEVPSAMEMKENGLNLKEMNLLLLKKVEELTLYLLQEKEEIEALKERNTRLEKEMKALKLK